MLKPIVIAISVLMGTNSHAVFNIPGIDVQTLNRADDQTLAKAGLTINEDDILINQDSNKLILNDAQIHESKVWGLTLEEEKRYVLLMQNRSNIYYRGLRQTPLDILGINARDESERNHFAELAAAQEAQKVAKNIAWNNAFHKAYNQLFANIPVVGDFDPSPYSPYAHQPVQLNEGDTLYLFAHADDAIKTILLTLTEAIATTHDTRLHLLFLEMDALAIELWANKFQIPENLVKTERITLSQGDLNYQALKIKNKNTPLLLLSRNGISSIVDLGKF